MARRRPPLVAELCAGLAPLSLALQGGRHCRPPCSRPGNKAALVIPLLALVGLAPGDGASVFLWTEPEPGPRALLQTYPNPDALRACASTIRGWIGRDPRPLWEELKAEGPAAGVPGWLYVQGNSFPGGGGWKSLPTNHPGCTANRSAAGLAKDMDALSRIHFPPVLLGTDARTVDPREVARFLLLQRWSFREKGPDWGWGGPGVTVDSPGTNWTTENRDAALERPRLADLVERAIIDWPPVLVGDDARCATPDGDLEGAVCYIDPSYADQEATATAPARKMTGYQNNLTRAEVVELALRWDAVGATVMVSEAVPVAELSRPGWEAVRIDGERRGQARTWSRQSEEWVSMNRAPVSRPGRQGALFAVSA